MSCIKQSKIIKNVNTMFKKYNQYKMIYGSIRVHVGPCGPIWVARGEKSQVQKVQINISDRDFFLGLFRGDNQPPDDKLVKLCSPQHIENINI